MQITWYGQTCFKITTKQAGADVVIVTDPYSQKCGLKVPRLHSDIVAISNVKSEYQNPEGTHGTTLSPEPFLITTPGEYEMKGVFITAIKAGDDKSQNIIFRIDAEGISILHLGDFSLKKISEEILERIGTIDVLMVPIGGNGSLDKLQAVNVVNELEPRIIIPMRYKLPGLDIKLDPIEGFAKEMGITKIEQITKFKLLKKDLPQAGSEVVIFDKI